MEEVKFTEAELARKMIEVEVDRLDSNLYMSMGQLVERYGAESILVVETDYYYDDAEVTIYVRRIREETDDELEARLERLRVSKVKYAARRAKALETKEQKAAAKAQREAEKDRAEYERLRVKHGW